MATIEQIKIAIETWLATPLTADEVTELFNAGRGKFYDFS